MAVLDSLLHHTITDARRAQRHAEQTIQLYSNIGQRPVVQQLLDQRYPRHNIRIEDTATGGVTLFERPGLTPNHTWRQMAGGNHTVYRQGLPPQTVTYGGARLMATASALSFDGIDFVIHQTGMSAAQQDEMRSLVGRIAFLGVRFDIVTP